TLERIKKESGKTLASILLANLLVNIAASSVGAIILIQIITTHALNVTASFVIEFFIMTSLLLIIGEITPKTIAIGNAEFFALKFGKAIAFLSKIVGPLSSLLELFVQRIGTHQIGKGQRSVSDKEIKLMLSEAKKFKVLDEGEEKFGYQILKFGKMIVSEIMTPRQKVVGVDIDSSIDTARNVITSSKHSRICVFDRDGNVAGILYAKDMFIRQHGVIIKELMRDPYIVPETKQIDNLLRELRKNGIHISVVVDEFGNFSGIVTLEDILESIFGEIIDEYDELADLPYKKLSPDTFMVEGDITISEISRILNIEPFAKEGERLSGFILSHFGKIPKEKETFTVADIEITVEEIHDRIIEKVRIKKVSR
ncbi:MAG: HlyC/CorC family transporter, partial [candidate division WOR-3 bacterium]